MANAAITTLITGLGTIATDSTITDQFQNDVIFELSRGVYPNVLAQVGSAFVAATAGNARYTIPTTSGARTPLMIFYDIYQLLQITKEEARSYDEAWRGNPTQQVVGYTFDPEDRVNFSLVPPPRESGATIGGNTPTNVTTWPQNNITVIYAATDTAFAGTTYDDLKLPIAFEVLAREFGRDSDHQDITMSQISHNMAAFFFAMFNPIGKPV